MNSSEQTNDVLGADSNAAGVAESWFGGLSQADFEIDLYERISARQPADIRCLRILGELYARAGRFDQALAIDRRLIAILPNDAIVVYNLACSLAMNGAAEAALAELDHALELGYLDFSHLEIDPDLESVRRLPQFAELLKKYALPIA
jgi:tetratricopeptide (TPR) repeat protein